MIVLARPSAAPPAAPSDPGKAAAARVFSHLVEPFVREARGIFDARVAALPADGAPFDARTVGALFEEGWRRALRLAAERTLVLELHVAKLRGALTGDTPAERFESFAALLQDAEYRRALFAEYPVLASHLPQLARARAHAAAEFAQRLHADWTHVRAEFASADPGALSSVEADAGDAHCGGRSVCVARFASGLRVVYKPRPLAVEAAYAALLDWVNGHGLRPTLSAPRVLDRGGYGWVEFAAYADCRAPGELRRFYQRQGAHLALLHVLEATDMHMGNVIAAGEHPMLVDLECLFQPRLEEEIVGVRSVMRVGLLPTAATPGDRSGLGGVPGAESADPVRCWLDAGTDEMRMGKQRIPVPGGQNLAHLNGAPAMPSDYAEQLAAGFAAAYRLVCSHRAELLAAGGPLDGFATARVRVVPRNTRFYGELLRSAYHPDSLRGPGARSAAWRFLTRVPRLDPILAAETHDLESGDVPFFSTTPSSTQLRDARGEPVAGMIHRPALEVVRDTVAALDENDLARELSTIRAAMAAHRPPPGDAEARDILPPSGPPATAETCLALAARITRRLCTLAGGEGDRTMWIGLTAGQGGAWGVKGLGQALYDGMPGVVLFLAYSAAHTGDARAEALARDGLATLLRQHRASTEPLAISAFEGQGGLVYLLTHLGVLWNDAALLDEAEALALRLSAEVEADVVHDWIAGAAGLVGVLLGLHAVRPSAALLAAAARWGESLLAAALPQAAGLAWITVEGTQPLTGYAHGTTGIAVALLRLARATGDARFAHAARAALEYERAVFLPELGNWPDFRKGKPNMAARVWCHGAPGIALARLEALDHLDDPRIAAEIEIALGTTVDALRSAPNHTLCHGAFGNLAPLTEAARRFPASRWADEAVRATDRIVASVATRGALSATPDLVEAPGLMIGLAGIGMELLRLAAPSAVPLVLTLQPPPIQSE